MEDYMIRFDVCRNMFCLFLVLVLSVPSLALPKYLKTSLPLPEHMDDADRYMVAEVINLAVHEDSEDPNQYYYVPPFHIRQYKQGAAGMLLNTLMIREYAAAKVAVKKELEARAKYAEEYDHQELSRLRAEVAQNKSNVKDAELKLEEAMAGGNEQIIALRKESLAREAAFLEESILELADANEILAEKRHLLPPGLGRGYYERALNHLAYAGSSIPYSGGEDPEILEPVIEQALDSLGGGYGGYISINAYGGFTKKQLDALTAYKTKYMPHIKLSLLPLEKLTFVPLTELHQYNWASAKPVSMFRQVNGSGDYLGAAVVIDITIAGAIGLSEHMTPFIPPLGIKATLKQYMEPTEAELVCDFTSGFTMLGQADVRDGKDIYDNDVMINMEASDKSEGACKINHISGDRASAEYKALFELQKELEAAHVYKTNLAYQERKRYNDAVIRDIHNNRRDSRGTIRRIRTIYSKNGWDMSDITQLSSIAADFHWHTNSQNVSNLSSLKFTKKISVTGNETITKDLPMNLCLVYNPEVNAYDRCTEIDEGIATGMQEAMHNAESSEECREASDPIDCGKRRDKSGRFGNGRASSSSDHHLSEEI